MKNLNLLNLTLLAILASTTACNNIPESDYWAKQNPYSDPVTIFYEDFGTAAVATPWPAVADYTGYKKEGVGAAAVTFAAEGGMVSVRGNSNSSGYDGVSGSCNAMAAAAGATFLINDIATCGAVNLELSFGSNQTNDTLAVSYKINATNDWVPITYTKTTNAWGLASDIKITLPAGTNTIKLKFVALRTQFGTRLDDIKITSTDQLGAPVITPDDGGGAVIGDTLTVAQAIVNQNSEIKWVKGYIVGGIIDDNNATSTIDGPEDVIFGANVRNTAVLIADSKTETDYTKCVVVNLPSGAIRNAVNLKSNPSNLGKSLNVQGTLRVYFGQPGVRDLTNYILEGSGGNPPDPAAILNETLLTQASFDKFTAVSVSGDLAWNFSTSFGAVMSGYDTISHANEDWFISPIVNLAGKSNVILTFDHARGPAASMSVSTDNYTLWISTNYTSGAPSAATWTQLAIPTHGTATWAYVSSGNIAIPADKLTATTRFAFKYICSDSESATWEVKNIVVK
jgi:hypothetical protein